MCEADFRTSLLIYAFMSIVVRQELLQQVNYQITRELSLRCIQEISEKGKPFLHGKSKILNMEKARLSMEKAI